MEPVDILERAARYHSYLKLMSLEWCDYTHIIRDRGKSYTSVDNVIKGLKKAGLVEVTSKPISGPGKRKKYVKLSESGKENLDFIEKYIQYFSVNPPDEEIEAKINEIIQNVEKFDGRIRDHYIDELRQICRTRIEAVHLPKLWNFFAQHLEKKELQPGIDDCIKVSIKYMIIHKNSREYLEENLLPMIQRQLSDKAIDAKIRMIRAAFLWEVYENDYKKDEILRYLIDLFKRECHNNGSDLCSWIESALRGEPKDQLLDKLLESDYEPEVIKRFID
jgi:nitrogen regulatory protein PII